MVWLTGSHADSIVNDAIGFMPQTNRWDLGVINGEEIQIAVREDSRSRAIYLVFKKSVTGGGRDKFEAIAASAGARNIGSTALETYRISRGIASRGRELTDAFNPYEAGLRETISFTKGCYIGQEVIARLDTYQKIKRKLIGLDFREGSPGHQPQSLLKFGKEIGLLTSVTPSTVRGRVFGLGIVIEADVAPGDELMTSISGSQGVVKEFPLC